MSQRFLRILRKTREDCILAIPDRCGSQENGADEFGLSNSNSGSCQARYNYDGLSNQRFCRFPKARPDDAL